MKRGIAIPALIVVLAISPVVSADTDQVAFDNTPRLALLVGIQQYANLSAAEQLNGCSNDVAAMKRLLIDRFGFSDAGIVTLTNEAATGAGLRAALDDLVRRVRQLPQTGPPAQVVFHFSGHGSQVPDQPAGDPDQDEEDGLDETLVPHDALRQGGERDIRDDELSAVVDYICRGGRARLWVVLDCCHSGTGVRGATKVRKLERPRLVPTKSIGPVAPKRLADGCVVLSACRANEVEPEYQDESGHFGLLTRFLVQMLLQRPTISSVSYKTLQESIVTRYRGDPSIVQPPTPQLEGNYEVLDEVVLGAGQNMDRPPCWEVAPAGRNLGQAMLLAGQLHGVTTGSLYELAASPDAFTSEPTEQTRASSPSANWIRIDKVEGTMSVGSVFQWADAQQDEQVDAVLPRGFKRGFAVERYHEPGALGIRVRVVRAIDAEQDSTSLSPAQAPAAVRQALQQAQRPGEMDWITWTDDDTPCQVLLRIDGSHAALFPATGLAETGQTVSTRGGTVPASLKGGWGPIDLRQPDQAITELQGYLRRIARARNLLRLAASKQTESTSDVAVALDLLAVQLNDDYRVVESKPWPSDSNRRCMSLDDVYALQVSNNDGLSDKPFYVTVLAIDPNMEIQVVLPYQEGVGLIDEQRLDAGANRITDAFLCSDPVGPRWAVALATREPNDFYILAQPALPRHRGASSVQDTPLRSLLLEHTYFQSRGDRRFRPVKLYDDTWSAAVLRWDATP